MSEKFTVPEGIINRINEIFPNSEERRKIAYTMMFWNKKPSTIELAEIGEKVGRTRGTANIVLQRMLEEGIMTEEFGSVPLFRHTEKMRLSVEPIEHDVNNLPITPKTDIPDVTEEEEKEVNDNDSEDIEKPPFEVDDSMRAQELENRLALQEADLKELRSTIDTSFTNIKEMINNLSIENSKDNPSIVKTEVVESFLPQNIDDFDTVEDLANAVFERINKLQNNSLDIVETENPQEVRAQELEVYANPDELIELKGQITAHKMIGFLPKSLILYDLSVKEGFDGNIADFVNTCIADSFKGRNIELAVIDKTVIT